MCPLVRYGLPRAGRHVGSEVSSSGRFGPLSATRRRVPRRTVLRYSLIGLAVLIVLANVLGERSAAVDAAGARPAPGSALAALAQLEVRTPGPDTGFARDVFGAVWADLDGDGCDTRDDVLARDLTDLAFGTDGAACQVRAGTLVDPYTGERLAFRQGADEPVRVDHVVPLLDAWRQGARGWDDATRERFANDPLNLVASGSATSCRSTTSRSSTW